MTSVYSEGVHNEQLKEEQVQEQASQENIEQEAESPLDDIEVVVEDDSEIQRSNITSSDVSYTENSFSILKFFGRLSVNLVLPFINGLMLGFGEIIAHEIGFHYNWTGSRVSIV